MTTDPTSADAYAWPRPHTAPTLAEQHARYLAERGHTLSTAALPDGPLRWRAQAIYVLKEAVELGDAVIGGSFDPESDPRPVRHEIADVVLSVVTLANYLGVTVEDCIAEKTTADRGRG